MRKKCDGKKWTRLRVGMTAVAGALALALIAIGCGGGGNSNVFPFAGVWVANSAGPNVLHFAGNPLNVSSGTLNLPPSTKVTSAFVSPQDTVFDSGSNLWVVDGGKNDGHGTGAAIYEFTLAQLTKLNSQSAPTPAFTVTSPVGGPAFFSFPQFAVFDGGGNLWVSDSGNNQIFEFTATQLKSATGLAVVPAAVLIGSVAGVFNAPIGMAFDGGGNLWVANNGGTTIVEIPAATLIGATGITLVTPSTVLTSTVSGGLQTINNPWGIVFDASHNLWIANEQLSVGACSGNVVEFAAGAIGGGGILTPPPNVMITQAAVAGTQSLCDPNGISMNSAGNITVANAANNSLAEYTASQITGSGAPTPNVFIFGAATTLAGPTGISYGPLFLQ